jgi:hypothetical protein
LYVADVVPSETTLQSGRISKQTDRLQFIQYNLLTQGHKEAKYTEEMAKAIAKKIN